jgi:hypothetical protein
MTERGKGEEDNTAVSRWIILKGPMLLVFSRLNEFLSESSFMV